MKRTIIQINEEKCVGCGLCTKACKEGALALVNGKAKLMRDDYCDGLGNCLPVCPTDAISFVERDTLPFDKEAAHAHKEEKVQPPVGGCPGSKAKSFTPHSQQSNYNGHDHPPESGHNRPPHHHRPPYKAKTELNQWPVQLKLIPENSPVFEGAHLLIAADCCAYAYGNFHQEFMAGKVTLIGCPKLDEGSYTQKLIQIIQGNHIKSVTIARMDVPCCGGLQNAVTTALQESGKFLPWSLVTVTTEGVIIINE